MKKRDESSFLKGALKQLKKLNDKVNQLIDIKEFSMNYSFDYHCCNNIDDTHNKEAMFIEVKSYLKTIKVRG